MNLIPVPRPLGGEGPDGEKVGDPHPQCDYCEATEGVRWRRAHTAYCDYYPDYTVFDFIKYDEDPPLPPDPNPPKPLCGRCAEEDAAYWDEMWKEYYHARM